MCRSQKAPDGPRSCSKDKRDEFAATATTVVALKDREARIDELLSTLPPEATGLVHEFDDPDEKLSYLEAQNTYLSGQKSSKLAEAEGAYSNIDRQERVQAMIGDLKSQIAGLGTADQWKQYLSSVSRFHNYSLNNRILIQMQAPEARHVAGFKKWKEFGRSVNKGEKAIHILAPRMIKDKDDLDEEGKPRQKIVGFTSVSVFGDHQTSGDPLPEPPTIQFDRLTGEAPAQMHTDLDEQIAKKGYTVHEEDLGENGPDGYTSAAMKRVVINSRYSDAHKAVTKGHEWAHIELGHVDESYAYHTGEGGQRSTAEVEAEATAWVIGKHYGLESKESFSYIDGWAHGDTEKITKSAERVGKACDTFLAASGK